MTVKDILDIAGDSVKVIQDIHCIENVDTKNDLIAPYVFTANVSCITAEEDRLGNYVLVLEIKEV